MATTDRAIAARIRDVVAARGPDKTCCPSDIARALADEDWRALMPQVRRVAGELAASGEVVVTAKGQPVDIRQASGPVRIGLADSGKHT